MRDGPAATRSNGSIVGSRSIGVPLGGRRSAVGDTGFLKASGYVLRLFSLQAAEFGQILFQGLFVLQADLIHFAGQIEIIAQDTPKYPISIDFGWHQLRTVRGEDFIGFGLGSDRPSSNPVRGILDREYSIHSLHLNLMIDVATLKTVDANDSPQNLKD